MVTIGTAGLTAEIDAEGGGRLARLVWQRQSGELVDVIVPLTTSVVPPHWPKGGAYPLIPYGNRIAQGQLSFLGQTYEIAPHPDAYPHSLHGHTQLQPWIYATSGPAQIELFIRCDRGKDWPWAFEARQCFTLERDRILVTLSIRNVDSAPMPAGLGWHPYFVTTASAKLFFDAQDWWPHTPDFLPVGHPQRVSADLRSPLVIGPMGLTAYLGRWTGNVSIYHDNGVQVTLLADRVFDHLVIHQPANGAYLCVEPVTHVANGFNLAASGVEGTGLRILESGAELTGKLSVAISERTQQR